VAVDPTPKTLAFDQLPEGQLEDPGGVGLIGQAQRFGQQGRLFGVEANLNLGRLGDGAAAIVFGLETLHPHALHPPVKPRL
jgi:hypothetical protein